MYMMDCVSTVQFYSLLTYINKLFYIVSVCLSVCLSVCIIEWWPFLPQTLLADWQLLMPSEAVELREEVCVHTSSSTC